MGILLSKNIDIYKNLAMKRQEDTLIVTKISRNKLENQLDIDNLLQHKQILAPLGEAPWEDQIKVARHKKPDPHVQHLILQLLYEELNNVPTFHKPTTVRAKKQYDLKKYVGEKSQDLRQQIPPGLYHLIDLSQIQVP